MPIVWKPKDQKRYKKHSIFTVSRTERFARPDRVDKVTMKWFGKKVTIWERAS